MPKPTHPDGPAVAAFVAAMTPEERGALPSRLRRLAADEAVVAWNAAKSERDAAIAAAQARVDPDDPESDYVIPEPAERVAAIAAARAGWATHKAELLSGEG